MLVDETVSGDWSPAGKGPGAEVRSMRTLTSKERQSSM